MICHDRRDNQAVNLAAVCTVSLRGGTVVDRKYERHDDDARIFPSPVDGSSMAALGLLVPGADGAPLVGEEELEVGRLPYYSANVRAWTPGGERLVALRPAGTVPSSRRWEPR